MPKYPDAVGYINQVTSEINQGWFTQLQAWAIDDALVTLSKTHFDQICPLLLEKASLLKKAAAPKLPQTSTSRPVTAESIETLSSFSGFKQLGDTLSLRFDHQKRITIVFGTNGSGKSSLCEALKILADPKTPIRPITNVKKSPTSPASFKYKFRSEATESIWNPSSGYGIRQSHIKYFDSSVAVRNISATIEPSQIITVTPFRLGLFETMKSMTTSVKDVLQKEKLKIEAEVKLKLDEIRRKFNKYPTLPLSSITESSNTVLKQAISLGELFAGQVNLKKKQDEAKELEKATQEDGLKFIKSEHKDLEVLVESLTQLIQHIESFQSKDILKIRQEIANKKTAQQELAKQIIPQPATLDQFTSLLRASAPLCTLSDALDKECPLCRQKLTITEAQLFKKYHELLTGDLETKLTALQADADTALKLHTDILGVNRKAWKKLSLPPEELTSMEELSDKIIDDCSLNQKPSPQFSQNLSDFKALLLTYMSKVESKSKAIESASKGREPLLKDLLSLNKEIEALGYQALAHESIAILKDIQNSISEISLLTLKISSFQGILKKLTMSAKEAYEDLVVADFETRLGNEYKSLAEKTMTSFGVVLTRKGTEASVNVLPQIGGKEISTVLSEGEQRIHALALFFAELETSQHPIIAFDDPVSSFDYNYTANYCNRLRDFTAKHTSRQLIVFTHSWDFFIQLQTTLKASNLTAHLSIQVLESCSAVNDYTDRIDDLKTAISAILSAAGEPTKAKKEEMAGKMRRLIESIVNEHVFRGKRHQFRAKNQQVSEFHEFSKLVPLTAQEATHLRDLFSKLSISEHDDPRTCYTNTDKAMFQLRYDIIIDVERALIARKVP